MSTIDSDDLGAAGYFLPEDSGLRLRKLRGYVASLADLARPRTAGEGEERTAEARMGEVASCLKLLEEQIGRVLDELSRPAERGGRVASVKPGASLPEAGQSKGDAADTTEAVPDEARYLFGITLDQVDEINLLLDMIRAHGDAVIASDVAEFADHTLSLLGHAIFCDADKLHDIVNDIELQTLRPARGAQAGVGEERAAYRALPAPSLAGGASHYVGQCPTYQ